MNIAIGILETELRKDLKILKRYKSYEGNYSKAIESKQKECNEIQEAIKILSNELQSVNCNEQKEKKCSCGKSVPSECDGNCIWDGVGYR